MKDAARSPILEMVRGLGRDDALAEKQIVAAAGEAGIGRTSVREALRELVADGSLLRDKGVSGLPKNAYGYWPSGANTAAAEVASSPLAPWSISPAVSTARSSGRVMTASCK